MWSRTLFALLPLAAQLSGSALAEPDIPETDYEAIIVGGGPAGLSALSGLARVRRHTLLIDSGDYRNNPTRHMHDVIGFDGVTPAYYRWAAREQLSHYDTAELTNGTVTKIEPRDNNTVFTVTTDFPDGERAVTARRIVLATGLHDLLPETPGLIDNWGKGIYWCPWCDGHEHADQSLGIIANFSSIPGLVREMVSLNTDVVAFVNGTDTPEQHEIADEEFPDWQIYLELKNVTVVNATINEIERLRDGTPENPDPSLPTQPENDLFLVHLDDGETIERNAFFVSFPDEQASWIGPEMGVRLDGGRLAADNSKGLVTNIPNVYAVGDANADNVTNVPHALFSGKRTAVSLHVSLERENALAEIADFKAGNLTERGLDDEEFFRTLWARMNGEPGDLLYAGEYDQ